MGGNNTIQFKMEKRQQQQEQDSSEWRYKIIKWMSLQVNTYSLPFFKLQLLLQVLFHLQLLKLSIDYFPHAWFAAPQPFFLFLDLSYYFNFVSPAVFFDYLIVFLVAMNLYWMLPFLMQLYGIEKSNTMANFTKGLFLVMKNVLLVPAFNILLNLFNCSGDVPFRKCYEDYSMPFLFVFVLSFAALFTCLLGQAFLDFQFLPRDKTEVRTRRSGITSCLWMVYALANQLNSYFLEENGQLVVLNLSTMGLLVAVILTDDQVHEGIKLMQCGFIAVQLLGALFVDVWAMVSPGLPPFLFALLAPLLFLAVMQLKTTNLRFQLQNINKWPTPQIMISYAAKLRHYLALRNDYSHLIYIHGYMEIHRQKCDNPNCPSRCDLPQADQKLLESGAVPSNQQQLLRCENIIKNIYSDGYRLTPISPELQLEYATFLYQRGEKELALRRLLAMKVERLSLDKFYRLQVLKEKIHKQLNQSNNKFLDLVSEMLAKRQQQKIMQRFERAALINLQFWSLLNDDHPDFQKLNEVALARIRIREQIRINYAQICRIAHSERVTACYANYLQSIENDEHMFNEIYSAIKKKYELEGKVTLQDRANSSSNVMLVSVEDSSFAKIVDVNTSYATALGYQKFQLQGHSLRMLFPEELKNEIKDFLGEHTNGQHFLLSHKSGYLMQVGKQAQSYNSMETGMAAILTLQPLLNPHSCAFLLDRNSRVAGVTPTVIPLLGIDHRAFEVEASAGQIFVGDVGTLKAMANDKDRNYLLKELVKRQFYDSEERGNSLFKFSFTEQSKHSILQLREVVRGRHSSLDKSVASIDFQFRVQGNVGCFKYMGGPRAEGTLSRFKKIQATYYEEQNQESIYSKGITTLRLKDNVIQIIEEDQIEDLNDQDNRDAEGSSERLILARKDEEEIFENKDTFQKFVSEYRIAAHMLVTMAIGLLGVVAIKVGYYSVYISHNHAIAQQSTELARQHLINGAITKEQCLLNGLHLAATGKSQQSGSHFLTLYKDNMQYLQSIQMTGSPPFPLTLTVDSQTTNILTQQFLLSMINSANQFASALTSNNSASQIWNYFLGMDIYAQSYLTSGSAAVKEQMYSRSLMREKEIGEWLESTMKKEAVMLSMGMLYLFLITILAFFVIHHINTERIDILGIFLQISDTKIQQFSNRTQKLLVSLHVQEASDELDDDNDKKVNSSMFSKKKSFKQVSFGKAIYLKVLLVPLFFLGYFIHSYVLTKTSLTFQKAAIPYFRLSASADYILYSDFSEILTAFLDPSDPPDGLQLATKIRVYYRTYFGIHYESFGQVADFHKTWHSLFFLNICAGKATPFGNTSIPESCIIQGMADNGTFMVVGDLALNIKDLNFSKPLSAIPQYEYQTLSKSHRFITNVLLEAQQQLSDSFGRKILQVLLVWLLCGLALIFLWGIPMTRSFVLQINEIKNIISILPVSLARDIPNARRYFHKILQGNGSC